MSLAKVKLINIGITVNKKIEILEYVQKYLKSGSGIEGQGTRKEIIPLIVVTPNPEQIVLAQKDRDFARILNQADIAIPDGVGILVALKFLVSKYQVSSVKRISGVDLMQNLVKIASDKGYRVGLIGGYGGLAVKAFDCLQKKYIKLQGWAEDGPDINLKSQKLKIKNTHSTSSGQASQISKFKDINHYLDYVVRKIGKTQTQMVFVGMGAPKQELLVSSIKDQACLPDRQVSRIKYQKPLILMVVGGSFDMISGKTLRAPKLLRQIGLEWAWRLVQEPWRWRRQRELITFIKLVLIEKLKNRF